MTTKHNLKMLRFIALVAVFAFLALSPAVGASPAGQSSNFPARIDLPNGFFPEGIERGRGTSFFVGSLLGRDDLAGRSSNRVGGGARGRRAGARVRRDRVRGRPRPDLGRRRRAAARRAAATCACTTHRAGRCSRRISRPESGC